MGIRHALAAAAILIAAFHGPAIAVQTDAPRAPATAIKVETVAQGLRNPWGFDFIGDGRIAVSERPGRLRIVEPGGSLSAPVAGLPPIAARGQGGLLDVTAAPDFAQTRKLYFTFAEPRGGGRSATAAARGKLVADDGGYRLENVEVIFRQQPAVASNYHFGSRIVFAPDGKVFITLGDRGRRDQAQDTKRHWAKLIRLNPDGSVPEDNPFVSDPNVLDEIWSIGHRNAQGAAINPATGKLWTVEHGAQGGDEINIPEAGRNYGWPVISYGRHYSGRKIGVGASKSGMEQPAYYWDPSIAPSGMAFYTGDLFPDWKGNVFVGALAHQKLVRLVLDGDAVVAEEHLLEDLGERIRAVREGPEGALYVLTDHPEGRVLRLSPAQ